ncbi:MAG: energy-coupling factor transporter transmembrane component T [Oscillospiraceae bacterium]
MRTLERAHPLTSLVYLLAVLAVTVFTRNPVLLAESLAGGLAALALSGGIKKAAFVPLFAVVVAVTNPIFSHNGVTVLFFVGDTAFTLEAVIYGFSFGVMLAAAVVWGMLSARYMTSDKYVWLFGRALPSAGLVLSCALRFVPLFVRRTGEYIAVRAADNGGKLTPKICLAALSSSMGYSAEEAMNAADSMRARGYGTVKRTFYSRYRLAASQLAALAAVTAPAVASAVLMISGAGAFYYYPAVSRLPHRPADIALYIAFGAICALPAAAIIREEIMLRRSGREISC